MVNIFRTNEGLFAQKIGAFPPLEILPEQQVLSYLDKSHQDYYKKALMNYSHGYGIGSFAYFRRITEEIIKKIIFDITSLEQDKTGVVGRAWQDYQVNHQMKPLLETINPYMPKGLLESGDNPLKLLYETSSVALHELSEEDALNKAKHIDVLLQFVIKKMNEEKNSLKDVREAMKELRGKKKS